MNLKKICDDVKHFFADLFAKIQKPLKKAVEIAVNVTNVMKVVDTTSGGVINFIEGLIPGDVDDKIVAAIRQNLPIIMVDLKLADEALAENDPEKAVLEGIKVIQNLCGNTRVLWLNNLAAMLAVVTSDGEINIKDAMHLVQWFYDHQHNPEVNTNV